MQIPIRLKSFSILGLVIGVWLTFDTAAESPDPGELGIRSSAGFRQAAPEGVGIDFPVFVFSRAGWDTDEVERVLREAVGIFAHECRFELRPRSIRYLDIRPRPRYLDETLQASLLTELGDIEHPAVFFVGDVEGGDIAFAYLLGSASASQGTAWISRRAVPVCRGTLLAHEMGHILLGVRYHHRDSSNLMASSCRSSNLANQAPNSELDWQQCELLWRRYASQGE